MAGTPKVQADMAQAGGRHYKGRGLGRATAWKCPACAGENMGPIEQGCIHCPSGRPGVQTRKPGEGIPLADREGRGGASPSPTGRAQAEPPMQRLSALSPAEQLRLRGRQQPAVAAVDYDEIERRVAGLLDLALGGGYTATERATLYAALECFITLWEDGTIDPGPGITLEGTRQLAAKVLPDEGIADTFSTGATDVTPASETETATETDSQASSSSSPGAEDQRRSGDELGDYDEYEFTVPGTGQPAPPAVRSAPQLLDPDHRGDQGGQDDPDRHGS